MKDKELRLEEIEVSHTLGGVGEGRVQGRGKWRGYTYYSDTETYTTPRWSHRRRHETWSDTEETKDRMVNQNETQPLFGHTRNFTCLL
jgi:hypothetical protein